MSIIKDLEKLDFHDSNIRGIHVYFSNGNNRSCILDIDYYNWEGNQDNRKLSPDSPWHWKRLLIKFQFLAHIEFSAQDLVNSAQELDEVEIGYNLSGFEEEYKRFKLEFPKGQYPLFESGEFVSIRFTTQNYSDAGAGYLWLAGNHVSIEWLDAEVLEGQIHIAVENA